MEKEFTAKDMIEFAQWMTDDTVSERDLQNYRIYLKTEEEREYKLYLTLKAKYETCLASR